MSHLKKTIRVVKSPLSGYVVHLIQNSHDHCTVWFTEISGVEVPSGFRIQNQTRVIRGNCYQLTHYHQNTGGCQLLVEDVDRESGERELADDPPPIGSGSCRCEDLELTPCEENQVPDCSGGGIQCIPVGGGNNMKKKEEKKDQKEDKGRRK